MSADLRAAAPAADPGKEVEEAGNRCLMDECDIREPKVKMVET